MILFKVLFEFHLKRLRIFTKSPNISKSVRRDSNKIFLYHDITNNNNSTDNNSAEGYANKSHRSNPPHISLGFLCFPLQSCSHSAHINLGSGNHVITFASDKRFGIVYLGRECSKVLKQQEEEVGKELDRRHPLLPGAFCGLRLCLYWRMILNLL